MDRDQFIALMESKGLQNKEAIFLLQDFISRFPYCQTGHLLLTKCLHDQHNILFDQQLKTTAAYVADRKILFELIHQQAQGIDQTEIPVFREEPVFPFTSSVFQDQKKEEEASRTAEENVFVESPADQNIFRDDFNEPGVASVPPEEKSFEEIQKPENEFGPVEQFQSAWDLEEPMPQKTDDEKISDPHEVIRKRLSEILGKHDASDSKIIHSESKSGVAKEASGQIDQSSEKKTTTKDQPTVKDDITPVKSLIENSASSPPSKSEEENIISRQAEHVRDVIDKIGLEHALEETIIHSIEKLPLLNKEVKKEDAPVFTESESKQESGDSGSHSFLDWLRIKSGKEFGYVEEVHAHEIAEPDMPDELAGEKENDNLQSGVPADELINQFIATEPRIVPSKAEFYSPVNQAKKSIAEHEDVVSETLAKIYFNQGNLQKARSSYIKLSLLHPEKSSYFAALIQKIDQQINKQE